MGRMGSLGDFPLLQGQWLVIFRNNRDSQWFIPTRELEFKHLSMQICFFNLRQGHSVLLFIQLFDRKSDILKQVMKSHFHFINSNKAGKEIRVFSLPVYCNKPAFFVITHKRSVLSSLQSASSVQKKKEKGSFFLNPSDTLADRWRGADHTAGGNTLV